MATASAEGGFTHTKEEFRVCPVTSFRVDRSSELLMVGHAVIAVLCLALGGLAALYIGLHKMPADAPGFLAVEDADYYKWVEVHGFNMLIFWIVWFEVAAGYFVATAILNSKLYSQKLGYGAFVIMLLGTLMVQYNILLREAHNPVMFTAYWPLSYKEYADTHWSFFLGYILFAVGVLVAGLNFFGTIYKAQKTKSYPHKSLPLVVYGVFVAFVIAVQAILNGAIVLILSWLMSMDVISPGDVDADFWKQIFWGFGHTAQYINISATAAVWYALITISTGAKPLNERLSRFAFLFYLLFTVPVSTHHLIVDPAYSLPFKMINATIMALGLAIPSMIHAFVIPGALEKQARVANPDMEKSLFGWIRTLPWKEQPAIPAVFWSVGLFGIGGILGSIQGTYQLNMITHNTLRINGHFHLTVVAGTTVAFMGLAYYFIELIPRRKIFFGNLKSLQIHLYAVGLVLLSLGMFIAGVQGAPRRTSTYDFYQTDINWDPGLWILGIGAIIAVAGGALFIVLIVTSLFFGEKLPREGEDSQPIPAQNEDEENGTHTGLEAPGVMVLGLVYMAIFAVFYLVSFLILALGWEIHR
ncbi:MAG: cbb3-type cytochrome c oxidase subunit I [Candidatus Kariarchaeaceae archaeon]|jgi:cytochrome c oxidase subunit 1